MPVAIAYAIQGIQLIEQLISAGLNVSADLASLRPACQGCQCCHPSETSRFHRSPSTTCEIRKAKNKPMNFSNSRSDLRHRPLLRLVAQPGKQRLDLAARTLDVGREIVAVSDGEAHALDGNVEDAEPAARPPQPVVSRMTSVMRSDVPSSMPLVALTHTTSPGSSRPRRDADAPQTPA